MDVQWTVLWIKKKQYFLSYMPQLSWKLELFSNKKATLAASNLFSWFRTFSQYNAVTAKNSAIMRKTPTELKLVRYVNILLITEEKMEKS